MNEILDTVMTFINENTNILIGICIFLILVLIGYLIDNSVKSKRVRKDIKNKDQVPENIKKDIIEEAIDKKEVNKVENAELDKKFEDAVSTPTETVEINSNISDEIQKESPIENPEPSENEFEDFITNNADPLNLDLDNFAKDNSIVAQSDEFTIPSDNGIIDDIGTLSSNPIESSELDLTDTNEPVSNKDENIIPIGILDELNQNSNVLELDNSNNEDSKDEVTYKNSLKLSEILYGEDDKNLNIDLELQNNDISNDIKPEDIEPEEKSTSDITSYDDELDNIMKKLNNINSSENFDEDNYTNIF